MTNSYFVSSINFYKVWHLKTMLHFVVLCGRIETTFDPFGSCIDTIELILEIYVDLIYSTYQRINMHN